MFGGHSIDDLFKPTAKGEDADVADDTNVKRRKVTRYGQEVKLDSTDAEDILVTPHFMRSDPKWLQRKRLEDAGLVEVQQEKEEFITTKELTEEEIQAAEREWGEKGGLPHTGIHDRWDSSDDEVEVKPQRRSVLDDPDMLEGNARYTHRRGLYNFCLNKNCSAYHVKDLPIQQRWEGECCGMRNQPMPDGTILDPVLDESDEDEEDWDITDNDIAAMMLEDPETAKMLSGIKGVYSEMTPDVNEQEAACLAAVLALLAASTPLYEIEEEEEETEEDEEEEEEEEDPVGAFTDQVTSLLDGIDIALEGEVLEPFHTLKLSLSSLASSFGESKISFEEYKPQALELVREIKREFYQHRRETRPPKRNIEIDGKVYDI